MILVGTEVAAGLHWFLKYACNSSISWDMTGGDTIDTSCFESEKLEQIRERGPLHKGRSVPWHFYQNVVTPRYIAEAESPALLDFSMLSVPHKLLLIQYEYNL